AGGVAEGAWCVAAPGDSPLQADSSDTYSSSTANDLVVVMVETPVAGAEGRGTAAAVRPAPARRRRPARPARYGRGWRTAGRRWSRRTAAGPADTAGPGTAAGYRGRADAARTMRSPPAGRTARTPGRCIPPPSGNRPVRSPRGRPAPATVRPAAVSPLAANRGAGPNGGWRRARGSRGRPHTRHGRR